MGAGIRKHRKVREFETHLKQRSDRHPKSGYHLHDVVVVKPELALVPALGRIYIATSGAARTKWRVKR